MDNIQKIAVVIPCYGVQNHILDVIKKIGPEVSIIYVVDDCCPGSAGNLVDRHCKDPRIKVIHHLQNQGVGGAVMTGYSAAISDGLDIFVKIDGDGQMDPRLISDFISPILAGEADYTKGNRFFDLENLREMPKSRLLGNALLSFVTKLSSGYWNIFDPTNGYTAIHKDAVRHLPFGKISRRYFFETDLLFRLNTIKAVVLDIPMDAVYGKEVSNLKIRKIAFEFLVKHIRNFSKRIFYNYYLRDMSVASLELPLGLSLLLFGCSVGGYHWLQSWRADTYTSAGTVMLAALPIIIGLQFVLGFLAYDMRNVPVKPISRSRRDLNRTVND